MIVICEMHACLLYRGIWGHVPQENFEFIYVPLRIASDAIWDEISMTHICSKTCK